MVVTQRHFVLADLDGDVAQGLFQFFIDLAGRTRGRFWQIDVGGIATGGKAIGNQLAAMMGSFYGPVGGVAGIVVGLILLALIG